MKDLDRPRKQLPCPHRNSFDTDARSYLVVFDRLSWKVDETPSGLMTVVGG